MDRCPSLVLLALLLVACDDEGTPGPFWPCEAERTIPNYPGGSYRMGCGMDDDGERLLEVSCRKELYPDPSDGAQLGTLDLTFTYDGDDLVEMVIDDQFAGFEDATARTDTATWTFSDDAATVEIHRDIAEAGEQISFTARYEPDLVFPRPAIDLAELPDAPDALLDSTERVLRRDSPVELVTEHTYTYDGPPHQGTRTRTRDDGEVVTFHYDDRGRLVLVDGDVNPPEEYVYEGDRMVSSPLATYEYGHLGALRYRIARNNPQDVLSYDYGCGD